MMIRMRKYSIYLLLLCLCLLVLTNTYRASAEERPRYLDFIFSSVSEIDGTSRNYRIDMASSIEQFFKKVQEYIPQLSAEEIEWLNEEKKKSGDNNGSESLFEKAVVLRTSYPFLVSTTQESLTKIQDVIDGIKQKPDEEMFYWAVLSSMMLDIETFEPLETLVEQNKITLPESIKKDLFDYKPFTVPASIGQGILNHFCIPYAMPVREAPVKPSE